jgi:hypothetical protein
MYKSLSNINYLTMQLLQVIQSCFVCILRTWSLGLKNIIFYFMPVNSYIQNH